MCNFGIQTIIKTLILLVSFSVTYSSFAATPSTDFHPLEDIAKAAQDFALANADKSQQEIQVEVGKLDNRLRLHRCGLPLEAYSPGYQIRQGRSTVGVRCNDVKPWSLFVPVTVQHFRNVVVLTRPVLRGDVLTEQDISLKKIDVYRLSSGYFGEDRLTRLKGKVLTQSLSDGTILTPHHIKSAMAIKRGQHVTLIARNAVIEVRAEGKALSKGAIGERIKVKNLKTDRVVEGVIIDKQLINVNL